MRNMFSAYPEIILVDATYKLNDLRLPLFVMMVVDGNGESEIVGLMLTADEQNETIKMMMIFFQNKQSQLATHKLYHGRQGHDRATSVTRRTATSRTVNMPVPHNEKFPSRSND